MAALARRLTLAAAVAALLPLLSAAPGHAQAHTVYGYEDDLGMLHLSRTKQNAHYKDLFSTAGKDDRANFEEIVRALKAKDALGGPPLRMLAKVDLGPLPERGTKILQAAEAFMGAPYRLGGDTPAGVDCSGLTRAVFRHFGCDLPRQSRLQANLGAVVAMDGLAAGDLLFFSTNREVGINHVGIYLGGGRMLHSSSRRGGVAVDRLAGTEYESWFVTARRISGDPVDGGPGKKTTQ